MYCVRTRKCWIEPHMQYRRNPLTLKNWTSVHACCELAQLIVSKASFLVCSMARIFLYIYISGRTSCRKCSKCFYVYLNIRPMRYSAMQL